MDDKLAVTIGIVIIVVFATGVLYHAPDQIGSIVTNAVSALAGLATGAILTKKGE